MALGINDLDIYDDEFMEDAIYYFNDETVSDEDKRKLLDSLNKIFLDIVLGKKDK